MEYVKDCLIVVLFVGQYVEKFGKKYRDGCAVAVPVIAALHLGLIVRANLR